MSFIQKVLLQTKPLMYETRRFRGKINIQRPRKPHFTRQRVLDTCLPILPKKEKVFCNVNFVTPFKKEIHNPFEHILAKECSNWFNHSKMIAFLHLNAISMEDKTPIFAELKINNMHLRVYGKKIINFALQGTNYEAIFKLFTSHSNIVFSETIQVPKLLQILKKAPQLVLLAGIVDGKLLSKNEMVAYSELPPLDETRAQLCQVFSMGGLDLVQQITQHQLALVNNLDQYVKIQTECSTETKKPEND